MATIYNLAATSYTTTYYPAAWYSWQTATGSTTYTRAYTWQQWIGTSTPIYSLPLTSQLTEEQTREQEESRKQAVVQKKERAGRARALLLSVLDEQQKADLEAQGVFHVHTGKNVYRIKPGSAPKKIVQDREVVSYCIHPVTSFHMDDVAASIKLMLDWNEVQFLKTANATQLALSA